MDSLRSKTRTSCSQVARVLHPLRISKLTEGLGSPDPMKTSFPTPIQKRKLPPIPECHMRSRTVASAQNLDSWPGLLTEPPRQPDKQRGIAILLLEQEGVREFKEFPCHRPSTSQAREPKGRGGYSLPPLHFCSLLKGHSGNQHQSRESGSRN